MPESGVTKHNYLFCQFVNPARGYKGDHCDCFDSPSQRRTRLAKQRLAHLQADRTINQASTSGNQESAVASDPVVTKNLLSRRVWVLSSAGSIPSLWSGRLDRASALLKAPGLWMMEKLYSARKSDHRT